MKIAGPTHDVLNKIMWTAYEAGKANRKAEFADFEANLDIVECRRTEKDVDWMSDVFIPEAPSIFLTEASTEAAQYFASRDFVDVYLEDGMDERAVLASKIAKKTINLALNNKDIHHYQKYMQAREINRLAGYVYALCWWDQEVKEIPAPPKRYVEAALDETGSPVVDETGNLVSTIREEPQTAQVVLVDRFNWMPLDPRNVFTDNRYTYTPQDENGIIIRTEKTLEELKRDAKKNQYINLDLLEPLKPPEETDTSHESYNQAEQYQKAKFDAQPFDVLSCYGRRWAVVTKRDRFGYPAVIEPGYEENGEPKKDAEWVLCRHEMAYKGSTKVTIRFQAEPLRDGLGRPYAPVLRGLCYIHATKKNGMSSAKYLREGQIALNDTFNLSNDRVRLATMPTVAINTYEAENNDELYFEPEHFIPLQDVNQMKEFKITDNIQGAMLQAGIIRNSMEQIESTYPTTMGDPGKGSVTATAIQGSDTRSNIRNSYKSLTFEYTFLLDFYWMILQMTWQFMHPNTIQANYSPEEAQAFNPVGDYTYQPVTSNIELESNKYKKIQNLDQNIGRLAGLLKVVPEFLQLIVMMEKDILDLNGAEYRKYEKVLDNLMKAKVRPEGGEEGGDQQFTPRSPGDMKPEMTQNQTGLPVGTTEQYARGM